MLANLLWALASIPLITLPAATAGLFNVMSLWVRGKPPQLFEDFFGAMRRYWLTSTLVGLFDLLLGGLLVVNMFIFPLMDMSNPIALMSRSVTLFGALMLLLVNLYVWSLLVVLEMKPRQLFATALRLVFAHPLWSLGLLIAALVPIGIGIILPVIVLVFASASGSVFIVNWGAWRIIRQYLADEERLKLESRL
jgi:uncharacterized membrane protein YesL